MRRTVVFFLAVVLLMTLSGCSNSDDGTITNKLNQKLPAMGIGENNHLENSVYGFNEKDIVSVFYSGSQFREGSFPFERQEQYTSLINMLKKLELLDKVENYDKSNANNYLSYEIRLKNADTITFHFYDNVVDFGQGYFFFTDVNTIAIPEEITAVLIGIPEFKMYDYYDNPEDIDGLRSALIASAGEVDTAIVSRDDFSEQMNIYLTDSANENTSLYVREENDRYFLFKNFFSSYIFMGEISRESYDILVLACKNQFGTHEHFSVKSGETTIHPLRHFMYSINYDEQTGQGLAADGFPQLSEWLDKLESVYYEPDFELLVRDELATLSTSISIAERYYDDMALVDIEALPSGEYTIACSLTTQGDYVEKANKYNSSTDVYWFKLIKQ